jgi:hypothetical protein
MFLNNFSEDHSIKGFDCPMPYAAKCSECFFFNHILILNVLTHIRTEIIVWDWKGHCIKTSQCHLVVLMKQLLRKVNRFNLLMFCMGEFNLHRKEKQIYTVMYTYIFTCVSTHRHTYRGMES